MTHGNNEDDMEDPDEALSAVRGVVWGLIGVVILWTITLTLGLTVWMLIH